MNNSLINEILKEYEKTRIFNIHKLENRKKDLYSSTPKLQEIDNKLNKLSIDSAKSILQKNSEDILNNLKKEIETLKQEKSKVLKDLNLPNDYLQLHYNCNTCKDTGYVFENGKTSMCNCLKQKIYDIEYNDSNLNIIKNHTFDNFNINLFSDRADEIKYHSKISPKENILNIKSAVINFINKFDEEATKNLIFSGGTGLRENFFI